MKYSTHQFGISAILVILAHHYPVVSISGMLRQVVAYSSFSVYMFAFLSGVGLYFSLRKLTKK